MELLPSEGRNVLWFRSRGRGLRAGTRVPRGVARKAACRGDWTWAFKTGHGNL